MLVTRVFHNIRAGMLAGIAICVGRLAGGSDARRFSDMSYF